MLFRFLLVALLMAGAPVLIRAQTLTPPFLPVSDQASAGSVPLAAGGQSSPIYYDAADAAVVGIAAHALSADVQRVTGLTPLVSTDAPAHASRAVFVGTVGKSKLIDGLVAQGKINVSALQGKWEMYLATVVKEPVPGVAQALVIAGSDRRGTAFGVFGLSEAMGVSPWYWWADVTPATKSGLYVGPGTYVEPSPGVKYRGIFLNDEDWGLLPWAAKTFDPAAGSIGPDTYAKIFELLLRLHANFCWPAMHTPTRAFNTFPQNKVVADDYAIVMGSSHHEPMLRNTDEYDPKALGPYNYWTNRASIAHFWEGRVQENAAYENIYTIGMRGLTDDGIIAPPGTTTPQKAKELQDHVIPDQREMLARHVAADPATVPQIFVPYKEALTQYQAGLQVPDDVTLVWPDDNHGYIRELSNSKEQARRGGSGVYYHLSYWGVPKDFLWLCTTPPAMTWEEMSRAWDYDARRLWVVNIGDLKPGEIGMDFFLRLARNPEAFRHFGQQRYLVDWATQNFGASHADEIAHLLDEYYRLNIAVRPEHLNAAHSGFSLTTNGDESQRRLDAFSNLEATASRLSSALPANLRDAFYQLVLYPVRASNLMNRKVLLAERSRLYAVQGRAATAATAASAQAAFDAIQSETDHYNTGISGGKWNRMMSAHPHPTRDDVFGLPTLGKYDPPATVGLGVAVEGSSAVLATGAPGVLPEFNAATDQRYFIDVFDTGAAPLAWTAQADTPWTTLSRDRGTGDARLLVGIDWTKAPPGEHGSGTVTIRGAGVERTVRVSAFRPSVDDRSKLPAAVEDNGVVTFGADGFLASKPDAAGTGWQTVENAVPSSHAGVTIFPTTAASVDPASVTGAPSLTYQFYTFNAGPATVRAACLPTHRINAEHPGVRYAIALNDEPPQVVNVDADEYSKAWDVNVLRATAYGVSKHTISAAGPQTLRVWMVDPGVVLDNFRVQIGNPPGGEFEAEDLPVSGTSGQRYRTFTESAASAGAAAAFESVNVGEYFTLALPDLQAGKYDVALRVKELNNRGKVRLSVADSQNGTYMDIGDELDLYHPTDHYEEITRIPLTLTTPGTKYFKFRVTGRNPANTSGQSWIALDRIILTPAAKVN